VTLPRPVQRLINTARTRLPGVLDDSMVYELFTVMDQFLRDTNAWQERVPVFVRANVNEYEVETEDATGEIVRLLGVTHNDRPVRASMPTPGLLRFATMPNTDGQYFATMALTVTDPVREETGLPDYPDWLFTHSYNAMLDGLLAHMMSQPAKPYSNTTMALHHGRRFRSAISAARVSASRHHLYGGQSWMFPRTFPTGPR